MFFITEQIKKIFRLLGFDIIYKRPNPAYIRYKLLNNLNIKDLIDVGANEGQYAKGILKEKYKGNIYSFEPLKNTFNKLIDNKKNNHNLKCFKYALSNICGYQEMYKVPLSTECSLLEWKDKYSKVQKETVELITFDEWIRKEHLKLSNFWFKIDVEGYEKFVLEGSKENLSKAAIVELELSTLPRFKYEDTSYESTLNNMIYYMSQQNFSVIDMNLYQLKNNILLYAADVIFIRNDLKDQLKDLF